MKFNIYDYDNRPVEVDIPGELEDIDKIDVRVLSGDEVVWVYMKDGTCIHKDSSYSRSMTFYDASYCLKGDDIKKFVEWKPEDKVGDYSTFSYVRAWEL